MNWQDQLDSILSERADCARERARTTFDEFARPCSQSLVLYGAGNLGRKILRGLRQNQVEPVAFADANPALAGKTVEGLPVLAPAEAVRKFSDSTFVVCVWHPELKHGVENIVCSLSQMGARRAVSFPWLLWKYPETLLPYYLWDLPNKLLAEATAIRRACATLADDGSREQFVRQLQLRSRGDFRCLEDPAATPQYFPPELFTLLDDECFVDCGAYDGDTVRDFVRLSGGRFQRIIAFEPDPGNFKVLHAMVENSALLKHRTFLHQAAVSEATGKVRFAACSNTSSAMSSEGGMEVACERLDEVLANEAPTFIKMDIEGAEPAALAGARQVIERYQPLLAICLYHEQNHLWRLPLLMNELEPESRLSLRMYRHDGWELVGYSVPLSRITKA